MIGPRPVGTGSDYDEVCCEVDKVFQGRDLNDEIFRKEFSTFLLFSPFYIMQPVEFINMSWPKPAESYIGYLRYLNRTVKMWNGETSFPAFIVPMEPCISKIAEIFEADLGFDDEGSISTYIRSGFLLPRTSEPEFGIWFSTYWEISVAGFRDSSQADAFVYKNKHITFLDNDTALGPHRHNPDPTAAQGLGPYLVANHLGHSRLDG